MAATVKRYECSFCKLSYASGEVFIRHDCDIMNTSVACDVECRAAIKTFATRKAFVNHFTATHFTDNHTCKICTIRYAETDERMEHIDVHGKNDTGMRQMLVKEERVHVEETADATASAAAYYAAYNTAPAGSSRTTQYYGSASTSGSRKRVVQKGSSNGRPPKRARAIFEGARADPVSASLDSQSSASSSRQHKDLQSTPTPVMHATIPAAAAPIPLADSAVIPETACSSSTPVNLPATNPILSAILSTPSISDPPRDISEQNGPSSAPIPQVPTTSTSTPLAEIFSSPFFAQNSTKHFEQHIFPYARKEPTVTATLSVPPVQATPTMVEVKEEPADPAPVPPAVTPTHPTAASAIPAVAQLQPADNTVCAATSPLDLLSDPNALVAKVAEFLQTPEAGEMLQAATTAASAATVDSAGEEPQPADENANGRGSPFNQAFGTLFKTFLKTPGGVEAAAIAIKQIEGEENEEGHESAEAADIPAMSTIVDPLTSNTDEADDREPAADEPNEDMGEGGSDTVSKGYDSPQEAKNGAFIDAAGSTIADGQDGTRSRPNAIIERLRQMLPSSSNSYTAHITTFDALAPSHLLDASSAEVHDGEVDDGRDTAAETSHPSAIIDDPRNYDVFDFVDDEEKEEQSAASSDDEYVPGDCIGRVRWNLRSATRKQPARRRTRVEGMQRPAASSDDEDDVVKTSAPSRVQLSMKKTLEDDERDTQPAEQSAAGSGEDPVVHTPISALQEAEAEEAEATPLRQSPRKSVQHPAVGSDDETIEKAGPRLRSPLRIRIKKELIHHHTSDHEEELVRKSRTPQAGTTLNSDNEAESIPTRRSPRKPVQPVGSEDEAVEQAGPSQRRQSPRKHIKTEPVAAASSGDEEQVVRKSRQQKSRAIESEEEEEEQLAPRRQSPRKQKTEERVVTSAAVKKEQLSPSASNEGPTPRRESPRKQNKLVQQPGPSSDGEALSKPDRPRRSFVVKKEELEESDRQFAQKLSSHRLSARLSVKCEPREDEEEQDEDMAYWNGKTESNVCPKCGEPVTGSRKAHFKMYHYDSLYRFTEPSLTDLDRWLSCRAGAKDLGATGNKGRVCLHCSDRALHDGRYNLLQHMKKAHKEFFKQLKESYRLYSRTRRPLDDELRVHNTLN